MKNAYHVHTYYCKHAEGPIRPYVENAVKAGFSAIAFSDHSPQFYPGDYVCSYRMTPQEAPSYVSELRALREEYADRIKIYIGFEAEYYPELFPALRKLCEELKIDFLFMGQHATGNEYDSISRSVWGLGEDPESIWQYVNQVIEGMETGCFSMIAHPDVANFAGDENEYRAAMTQLCRRAKQLNIPLEYNLLGLRDHRHYPSDRFFRIAAEVGNTVTLGVDAHSSDVLTDKQTVALAEENLRRLGITPTDDITLRPLFSTKK